MERRKLRLMRGLINVSLLSLIFAAALQLLANLIGNGYAIALGLVGVALTFYCYRRADREDAGSFAYNLWRILPTLAFVLLPLGIFWYGSDAQWSGTEILMLTQIVTSYVLPLGCLLVVERGLKKAQQ